MMAALFVDRYHNDPIFVIIDVKPRDDDLGIPTTSYIAVEEVLAFTIASTIGLSFFLFVYSGHS